MASPIRISILANAARARAELGSTGNAAERMGSRFNSAARTIGLLAGGAAIAGIVAIGAATKVGVEDAIAYELAQKRASAALKANEGVAGQTLATLKSRAASIETLTGATYDENDVLQAQGRILRSGVEGQKAFGAATLAAANIAASGGTSIDAASKVIAKSLRDPEKAATALKKANVNLSVSQQNQIKDFIKGGDAAKAQGVVLDAVNKQLSGQAAALGKGTGASFKNLQDTLQDTARDLATQLLPTLTKVAEFISKNLPGAIEFLSSAFSTVKGAIAPLIPSLDQVQAAFSAFVTVISNPVFQAVSAAVAAVVVSLQLYAIYQTLVTKAAAAYVAVQAAINAVMAANPVGLIVLALIALAAAFAVAYARSETFRAIVNAAFQKIKEVAEAVWKFIQSVIQVALAAATAYINAYKAVASAVWSAISAAASAVWAVIKAVIGAAIAAITAIINAFRATATAIWSAISAAASTAFGVVRSVVSSVISGVVSLIGRVLSTGQRVFNGVKSVASTAFNAVKTAVFTAVLAVINKIGEIRGKVTSAVSGFASLLVHAGQELIAGLVRGITSKISAVGDAMSSVASKVKGFLPGSPVKEGPLVSWNNGGAGKRLMGLLRDGINKGGSGAVSAMQKVADGLDKAAGAKNLKGGSKTRNRLEGIADVLRDDAKSYGRAGALLEKTKEKIDSYTSKLNDALKARDDYAKSISDSVKRATSVLSIEELTEKILGDDGSSSERKFQTLQNIKDVLARRAAEAKNFVASILALRKAGFGKELIDELALAGAESSGATINELLKAKPADIAAINASQKSITDSATILGEKLAKTYYQSGVDQIQSMISGLESQQDKINKAMEAIAKNATAAYQRALAGGKVGQARDFSASSITSSLASSRTFKSAQEANASTATAPTLQVPAPTALDPLEAARQMIEWLAAYTALNGPARIEVVK